MAVPTAVTRIKASIVKSDFGTTANGEAVAVFTLTNTSGMKVVITNYGGIVISLTAPDREGKFENVVLGYDTLAGYETGTFYFGALIGRYCNRISGGRFELDGEIYSLARNNAPNHLHGGEQGFDKIAWQAEPSMSDDGPSLLLKHTGEDGKEGYPGNLVIEVRYTLTNDNELRIDFKAVTDKATPVNLTNHSYFNLSGEAKRDILTHQLEMAADCFLPIDNKLIPNGKFCPVDGLPFDFRTAKPVGDGIDADDEQIAFAGGYDHTWVFDRHGDGLLRHMATVTDPVSGRVLMVHSTEPGMQFYSGNFLDGSVVNNCAGFGKRYGLCLETQHFPDSPNQPNFPSTILQPGQVYSTQTVFSFTTV